QDFKAVGLAPLQDREGYRLQVAAEAVAADRFHASYLDRLNRSRQVNSPRVMDISARFPSPGNSAARAGGEHLRPVRPGHAEADLGVRAVEDVTAVAGGTHPAGHRLGRRPLAGGHVLAPAEAGVADLRQARAGALAVERVIELPLPRHV